MNRSRRALRARHHIRNPRNAALTIGLALGVLLAGPADAIPVTVYPGDYAGQWGRVDGGPVPSVWHVGSQVIEAAEGFNFMFVGGVSGFQFNVDAAGNVTTGAAATGGAGTLTFNTVDVAVDPGNFADEYFISRVVDDTSGPVTVSFVPTMNYATFVGGGNSARFNFHVGTDGLVTPISNVDAADGGFGTLTFNTTVVFVDPGAYSGSWQVPAIGFNESIIQAIGPASVTLVTGVVYVIIPDRPGMEFPVTDPCTTSELDFVDFVFTVGCAPVTFECVGFQPPMDKVAKVRKHRALPLKGALIDPDGFAVTDLDILAPPVIEVLFSANVGDVPVDVTDDALPVGSSSTGNTFSYDDSAERWRFNLSTENYSANGTYEITMKTGDVGEYALAPACAATFVIE